MSLTVAELRAVFTVDDTQFLAGLSRMDKAGQRMQKTGRAVTMGLTLPLLAMGVAAVKTEAQYSSTMNQLAVAAGVPSKQMAILDRLALKTGKDTVFSANEAAVAMLELAKGGLTAAQIKAGALAGTVALAATENMDLGAAATVVVNSLAQFNMKAGQAAKVADALAAGSIASTASVSSLSLGLQQVGPAAKTAGLNLYDTVGALALFDSNALKGADGGTSLKTMLARLVPQTSKAAKAMKALGLDFTTANGSFKSFPAIAAELQKGFGGLSQAERVKAINTIFGSDAQRAANILIDEGAVGVRKYVKATKVQGAAEEMAAARMKGTAGAIERMKGSLETAALLLGRAVAPAVQDAAEEVAALANWFAGLNKKTQTNAAILIALAAAAGPLLYVLGSMVRLVALAGKGVALLTRILGLNTLAVALSKSTLGTWIGVKHLELTAWVRTTAAAGRHRVALILSAAAARGAAAATKVFTAATWLLNLAMRMNPIGMVITALFLLAAALVYAWKHSKTFREVVSKVWDTIKEKTRFVALWVVDKVLWLAEKILGAMARAFGWAPGIGEKLKAAHAKIKAFRASVNKELDQIRDEKVMISIATIRSAANKNEAMLNRGGGGHGGGQGGGGPSFHASAPLSGVRGIAGQVGTEAKALAGTKADAIAKQLAKAMFTSGRVLPKGAYSVGMPFHGYPGHEGADYPAATGTPVRAMGAGSVSRALSLGYSYGKHAFLEHADGIQTRYAHLSSLFVRPGQKVNRGQMIGRVGSTGNSTGPHLHFEYRRNGQALNPAGLNLFDRGGWLLPGIPVNKTGKPEAVLTPEQSQAFLELARNAGNGDGGPRVQITQNVTPTPTMDTEALADASASRIVAGLAATGG